MRVLSFLLIPTAAFAIIGDDVDKVMKDYGSPVDASDGDPPSLTFHVHNFGVVVTFLNGISQCENYIPFEGDISESQILEIFKRNGRSEFKESQQLSSADRTVWESADKKLIAYVPKHGNNRGCMVATRDYINFLVDQRQRTKPH